MNYWLFKSEPSSFGIQDLQRQPQQTTYWDGVRNYQARNFIRDAIAVGDEVFFYHSNSQPKGIVGIMRVISAASPDPTAYDPQDPHYDPQSNPEKPRWFGLELQWVETFTQVLELQQLKQYEILQTMPLLRKGNRLSILPVTPEHWHFILKLKGLHSS